MKLSIVAEGGGLRIAYTFGALRALKNKFKLNAVDYVVGCSSSLGVLAYYMADQLELGYDNFPAQLDNKKFLSLRNLLRGKPVLDIDYLIDEIYKKNVPLDVDTIKKSKATFFIPLVNAKTGELKYFTNKSDEDFFEILRAGMAMQIGYGKTIKLNGENYFDAGSLNPLPLEIPEIKNSRKIIILTKNKGRHKGHWSDDMFIRLFKHQFSKPAYEIIKNHGNNYAKQVKEVQELEQNGDVVIRPNEYFSRYTNNKEHTKKLMDLGFKDTVNQSKLNNLKKEFPDNFRDDGKDI